jgi:hypothetical protein
MENIEVIPSIIDLIENNRLPKEIKAPDGTILMKPYATWKEQDLVVNRKKWKLFINYTPVESYPEKEIWLAKVNTTGEVIEIHEKEVIHMLNYIKTEHPGATVEEVINNTLSDVVRETGEFKDDNEMASYAFLLYLGLAYAIKNGLLILVKD